MSARPWVTEEERDIPVQEDVDVLVVGGGPAGVCAAVGAARAGARALLIERYGFLGGMWTAGMVLTLAGFNSWLRPYSRCVAGVPGEWLRRAVALGGAEDNASFVLNSDPEAMKRVADDMLIDAGVQVIFHTWGARALMEDGRVAGAFMENVEGRSAIRAKVTVDCTGDGNMIYQSGASWVKGQTLQPMTMPFTIGGGTPNPDVSHEEPMCFPIGPEPTTLRGPLADAHASRRVDVPLDRAAMASARRRGELPVYGGPWFGGLEKNVVWVNATRIIADASIARELTDSEIAGRRECVQILGYFRTHVPGFESARILQTSTQIGIRETRRLVGVRTLTAGEIENDPPPVSSIAVGCWPLDVHPSDGDVGVHEMRVPLPYGIPFECMVPQSVDGLLAAGRCISVDRDALGSLRVGATCAAVGHAAGVAAALAAQRSCSPRSVEVSDVRRELAIQGAIIDPPARVSTE